MNNLIKNEIIEKFKKYNFQKYPFVFTDVNYKNLINWNDLNKLLEKTQQKPAVLFGLIRIVTTWAPFSPQLPDTLELLGQDTTLSRLSSL